MTVSARLRHQYQFDQKRFWRDPAGLFYAIGFPLIFLVNFLGVLGGNDESAHIAGHTVLSKFYYVPGVLAMTVISVALVAVGLMSFRRRNLRLPA